MKNLGIEKWIELWLDSAGERVYQPALVSALSHSGYTILHNTSHNSLELGKDVICRDPNGELIALQLKGNPGSRFTIGQWQQLYNQILQLMHCTVPDAVTGKKAERHRPILVTNGEVEEDVVSAVTGFNQTEVPRLEGAKPLEVWKRGDLLKFFNNAANSVWPTDLGTQLLLQKATTADPTNSIDEEAIQAISLGALNWDDKPSTPQSFSRVSGLFTLLAIYVSPYIVQGNYYEATKVKAIGFCLAAEFLSKHQHTTKKHRSLLNIMRLDLISLLESFAEGIAERFAKVPFLEKDIFTEFGIYAARKMLVISLVAALAIEENGQVSDAIRHIITLPINYPFLASERLVPAFLSVFWAKEKLSSDRNNELELGGVLGSLLHCAKYSPLPSSYYRLEEVAAWRYKSYLGRHWHDIDGDNAKRRSQFSRALHALLAKRNWKQTCKIQWPDITRTSETFTRLHRPEEIGFAKSAAATEEDRFVNIPQTWEGLLSDILSTAKPRLPKLLEDDYVALLLLCIFLPYRATYELILYLDKKFGICWYK